MLTSGGGLVLTGSPAGALFAVLVGRSPCPSSCVPGAPGLTGGFPTDRIEGPLPAPLKHPRARRGVLADNFAVVVRLTPSVVVSLWLGCGRPPLDSPGSAPRRSKSPGGADPPPLHDTSIRQTPPALAASGSTTGGQGASQRRARGVQGGHSRSRTPALNNLRRQACDHKGMVGEDVPPTLGCLRGAGSGPSSRSTGEPSVNPGPPETEEAEAKGPDQEGTQLRK